jgi:CDP-paratose 2-epimerase
MGFRKILITGGAGFVGSNLAVLFKRHFDSISVVAADNLKRRGSELTLARLSSFGIDFQHADIRCPEDLAELPDFDLMIDCSAEPSVHAGGTGSPQYVLNTNLMGTLNCLEVARRKSAQFLFLSTSRVYPIEALNALPFVETETRFAWKNSEASDSHASGINEEFPMTGARSMYGASKLACEQIIREYVANYKMPAMINRCGVLAGPWQMGRVDQGVISLWCARHYYKKALRYTGFAGTGKQVRDVLHVEDLFDLLVKQLNQPSDWDGTPYNVGGGNDFSVSLRELTKICQDVVGNSIEITSVPETSPLDLRIYITDVRRVRQKFNWSPRRNVTDTVEDIFAWIRDNSELLKPILT